MKNSKVVLYSKLFLFVFMGDRREFGSPGQRSDIGEGEGCWTKEPLEYHKCLHGTDPRCMHACSQDLKQKCYHHWLNSEVFSSRICQDKMQKTDSTGFLSDLSSHIRFDAVLRCHRTDPVDIAGGWSRCFPLNKSCVYSRFSPWDVTGWQLQATSQLLHCAI